MIGAIVLAAGLSSRMGQHKILLPWADGRTVIEHIIHRLREAQVDHITVVTGHQADKLTPILKDTQTVYNPHYESGEMLSSIQTGLAALPDEIDAALIVLGDQPQIQPDVIRAVMATPGDLVVPSYHMRRGHPVLIGRKHWEEILTLKNTLRDFMNAHAIMYVNVETDSILRDLDTPQDYDSALKNR